MFNRYILIYLASFCVVYILRLQVKQNTNLKGGEEIILTSCLSSQPFIQDNIQTLKIANFYIRTTSYNQFHYGDCLKIVGRTTVRVINPLFKQIWLVNPSKIEFQSVNYKIQAIKIIMELLQSFREKLDLTFQKTLPEPHSSLLSGIFLGKQKTLNYNFYQALKTTGTIHIIVASGMNLSFISAMLLEFFSKLLGRKKAIVFSLAIIFLYSAMTGFNPPIVRAGFMLGLTYLAILMGREASGVYVLLLAGAVMLIINPFLLFDIGFQLSFTATLGLISFTPILKKVFKSFPACTCFPDQIGMAGRNLLSNLLAETIACQIFTLPILVVVFGHFNPLSALPNLMVLWLVPYLMGLAMLLGFTGLFFPLLAKFIGYLAWLPLTYFVSVINFFGSLKWLYLSTPKLSWVFGIGYYMILGGLLISDGKKK